MHRQPRRLKFHPGAAPGGPDLYEIQNHRVTESDDTQHTDQWNHRDSQLPIGDQPWRGRTTFYKKKAEAGKKEVINEKFLQNQRLASQGGYITFFYDSQMEVEEAAFPISIITWKSYKVKRCTVNTLSAECQAMIQGVGSLHWIRALLEESRGTILRLEDWEPTNSFHSLHCHHRLQEPVRHVSKCRNTASHISDKRTAIDVTILKSDFKKTQGQIRWVEGSRMVSDSLTKKMSGSFLRSVMEKGQWSLSERGFQTRNPQSF